MPVLVALVVLDLAILVLGARARSGHLPPFQRGADATTSASPSARPTAEPTTGGDELRGPLLLGANAAGLVLRATRGACESRFDRPAEVWVGRLDDDTGLQRSEVPTLTEVLALSVLADGSMRLVGLDQTCQPAAVASSDEGQTWRSAPTGGLWSLDADTTVASLTNPQGDAIEVTCVPGQVTNVSTGVATAGCDVPAFLVLRVGQDPVSLTAPQFTSVTAATPRARPAGSYYVFGATGECPAQVATVTPAAKTPQMGACLEGDKAPLAITTAGGRVLVQWGAELEVSDDFGASFSPTSTEATS